MLNPENELFTGISQRVAEDPEVKKYTERGYCRAWSANAKRVIMGSDLFPDAIQVEAREIDLDPWTSHSFLRVTIYDRAVYLMDGIGVGEEAKPYFGPEEDSPEYLKGSRPDDMINCYS